MVDLQTQPLHIPADRPPVEYQIAGWTLAYPSQNEGT